MRARVKRLAAALALFDSPRALPVALAVGVALRIPALWALASHPLVGDAVGYVYMAQRLLGGESFEPYYPPGASFLLVPALAAFGDSELVARAAMIPVYLAASLLLWAQTRALGGVRAANLAAAAFALYPTSIFLSVEPLTSMPSAACLVAIAWLAPSVATRPRLGAALALGLATGELALIRPSALPFVLLVPLYLALRGAGVRAAGVTFAVGALAVAGWLVHARAMTGRFVAVNDANSLNLFIGNNQYTPLYKTWWFGSHGAGDADVPAGYTAKEREIAALPPAERERRYRDEALAYIAARPDLFLLRTANRIRAYLALDSATAAWLRLYGLAGVFGALATMAAEALFYLAFLSGAVLACLAPPAERLARERQWVALGASLVYAAPYFVAFSHPTYHFTVVPLLLSLAACFVTRVASDSPDASLARLWSTRRAWLVAVFAALALIQLEWLAMNAGRL